jgi:uncharacterized protein
MTNRHSKSQKYKWIIGILLLLQGCSSISLIKDNWGDLANASSPVQEGQILPISARVKIAETEIDLEVAKTPEQQAIGLMFRESLPGDRGMLFPLQSERLASFWMKNVSIDLDMIFLQQGKVVHIANKVPPCRRDPCPIYGPNTFVDTVLELAGGRAEQLGLKVGDRVEIEYLKLP